MAQQPAADPPAATPTPATESAAPATPATGPAATAPPAADAATPTPTLAVDLEDRDAERLALTIPEAERRWLPLGERKLLAVWRAERRQPARGAVLLLHGAASSVDSPQVIRPLRADLGQAGWANLAIAMPRVASGSGLPSHPGLLPEVLSRFAAAEAFLKEQQREVVAIVAEDSAAVAALRLAQAAPPASLRALVLIGLEDHADIQTLFKSRSVAILDVLGDQVDPLAGAAADRRRAWASQVAGPTYRQVRAPGVADDWQAHRAQLRSLVLRFLNAHVGS